MRFVWIKLCDDDDDDNNDDDDEHTRVDANDCDDCEWRSCWQITIDVMNIKEITRFGISLSMIAEFVDE